MKRIAALGLVVLGSIVTLALRDTHGEIESAESPSDRHADTFSRAAGKANSAKVSPPSTPRISHRLLAAIEVETDPDHRGKALESAVESVSDAELPGVLDALAASDEPEAAELRDLLVRRWAEKDAPAAAAWAAEIPGGPARRDALEQIAIAWANSDLANALPWLQALPDDESKSAAMLGAAYEAARSEPLAAIELVRELSATRGRDDLLVHAISQWAIADAPAAAGWAGKISDLELQKRLLAAVAVASAEQDPATAATLIANSLDAGESQDRAAVAIVQRWTQSSPREAASWVAQFPDVPSREAAVQNLVALWTAQAPEAAANWLDEMPDGPLRDIGLNAYTQALTQTSETQ